MQISFDAIGIVHSPYKEKFAIPRQPGLVTSAAGQIELINDANHRDLVQGLEQFSHIWVLFVFHGTAQQGWKPLVRPPRLGGNKKMGVLATRSTYRPNPIGMSVVKLEDIIEKEQKILLNISGLDLLDQTPVIDIKPYIPYSDSISDAKAGFAQTSPSTALSVSFNTQSTQKLAAFETSHSELKSFISQVLAQDPRPAYKRHKNDDKIYGMKLYQLNIQWKMLSLTDVQVIDITSSTNI